MKNHKLAISQVKKYFLNHIKNHGEDPWLSLS